MAPNGARAGPARLRTWLGVALLAGGCATAAVRSVALAAEPGAGPAPQVRIPESIPVRRNGAGNSERSTPARALVIIAVVGIAAIVVAVRFRAPLAALGEGKPTLRWLRRWTRGASPGEVQVLQSIRLTPRATVHVLRWNGGELLVGCSDQGMAVLERRRVEGSAPQVDEETEP